MTVRLAAFGLLIWAGVAAAQSVHDSAGWHTDGWSFETIAAAQPGLWTLRGEDEGRVLFKVTFAVVPAIQRPDLAAACP